MSRAGMTQAEAEAQAAQFESELRDLLKKWDVMLTAEDGRVGYTAPFGAVYLSKYEYFCHDTQWETSDG